MDLPAATVISVGVLQGSVPTSLPALPLPGLKLGREAGEPVVFASNLTTLTVGWTKSVSQSDGPATEAGEEPRRDLSMTLVGRVADRASPIRDDCWDGGRGGSARGVEGALLSPGGIVRCYLAAAAERMLWSGSKRRPSHPVFRRSTGDLLWGKGRGDGRESKAAE